jgi:hypothetical protein
MWEIERWQSDYLFTIPNVLHPGVVLTPGCKPKEVIGKEAIVLKF